MSRGGHEMLRCAQHDTMGVQYDRLDLDGDEELSSSFEPCSGLFVYQALFCYHDAHDKLSSRNLEDGSAR